MRWKEFEALAREKGWYLSKHGSNHEMYKHDEIKTILVIERHWSQEIRPGLLKKLLRQIEGK